jgi:hypothetical protein
MNRRRGADILVCSVEIHLDVLWRGRERSVETNLDAADRTVRATIWLIGLTIFSDNSATGAATPAGAPLASRLQSPYDGGQDGYFR